LYHNLLFYILSSIPIEELNIVIDSVVDLIKKIFSKSILKEEDLKGTFESKPDTDGKIIYKGKCGISIDEFQKDKTKTNENIIEEMISYPSLYDSFFKVLLSDEDEPILLSGPSGYKVFLSKKILPQDEVISLNPESSVEQLLGSTVFLEDIEVKRFYLKYISLICQSNKYFDYTDELEKNNYEVNDEFKKKIENDIKRFKKITRNTKNI